MSSHEPEITEETIGAYVDGELEPTERMRLEARLREDPELERRVARAGALRARLEKAFAPALTEPVPERLLVVLRPPSDPAPLPSMVTRDAAKVVTLPPARQRAPRWMGYALAASVLLGVAVGLLLGRGSEPLIAQGANGGWVAAGALDRALTQQLSSESTASNVHVELSFTDHDGNYCRAFALAAANEGLACRRGGAWHIELLDRTTATPRSSSYRTASTPLSPALLAAIEGRMAGEPLDQETEGAARRSGWAQPSARP